VDILQIYLGTEMDTFSKNEEGVFIDKLDNFGSGKELKGEI